MSDRRAYSEHADGSDDAPVILAHETLVCADREVGLGDRATSFDDLWGHICGYVVRQ